ncbi:RNA polymerase sigma-70 factor [Aquabacterium sp.]|uniref:RNA polymerase sigma-70 factor n=1 Tax=Aquabacterium sp. TaxID=1872578 RepID=UPI00378423C4
MPMDPTAPPTVPPPPDDTATFAALRPRLFAIAYRMLGTRADAEDLVQDAWLRWHRTPDKAALQSAEAWLVTTVTRLAIDRLRAAKTEREAYIGWWLPEPLVAAVDERTPEAALALAGELSLAFLWVLERLTPDERAAFLLRQVFDHDYAEIATMLGRSEAACRQLVHRASERVQQQRPRFEVPPARHRQLLERFMHAAHTGAHAQMKALLADDVQLLGDGGGKVPSFGHVLEGPERVTNLYWAQWKRLGEQVRYRLVSLNGEPGLLRYVSGRLESAQAFVIDDQGRIAAIYAVRNPDKLAGIPGEL